MQFAFLPPVGCQTDPDRNDLIDASRWTRRPIWPWQSLLTRLPSITWPYTSSTVARQDVSLASGFKTLFVEDTSTRELTEAISAAAQVTTDLQERGIKEFQLSAETIELRNRAQHLVLSLPLYGKDPNMTMEATQSYPEIRSHHDGWEYTCLRRIVRLSLLAYNNLIVYPMPPVSGVGTRLAGQLRVELSSYTVDHCHSTIQALQIWSILLGGISTENEEDRSWFQQRFCEFIKRDGGLRKWQYTETMLTSFLWLDFVLNEEAIRFWTPCITDAKLDVYPTE